MAQRRMTSGEARRETKFIWVMVIIIALIILVALYGWYTGAWENTNVVQ